MAQHQTNRGGSHRFRLFAASGALVFALSLAALYLFAATNDDSRYVAAASQSPEITIEAPAEVDAGTALDVVLRSAEPTGTIHLVALHATGSYRFEAELKDGTATITISPDRTTHAGAVTWLAHLGASTASAETVISSVGPIDPVVPLVGPRTVIADGADETMVVVLPVDRFGNPLVDGSSVHISAELAGDRPFDGAVAVQAGIAAQRIRSTTDAGTVTVTSRVGDSAGPIGEYEQVPGTPQQFQVRFGLAGPRQSDDESRSRQPKLPLADGFSLHPISTTELVDLYNNVLPDGLRVVFVVDEGPAETGRTLIDATVQNGAATAWLRAPETAGVVRVSAEVSGQSSPTLEVGFADAAPQFEAVAERVDGIIEISIGPVVLATGSYPTDGTIARLRSVDSGDIAATAALLDGTATVSIPATALPVDVVILGSSTLVRLPS